MTKQRIVIELPLPAAGLHPNARVCWQQKARLTKAARYDAGLVARAQRPAKPFKTATVQMTFYMPRRRDQDGLVAWVKAIFDGLQDGGIIANDSGLTVLPPKQVTGTAAGRKLVMEIEESTQ